MYHDMCAPKYENCYTCIVLTNIYLVCMAHAMCLCWKANI